VLRRAAGGELRLPRGAIHVLRRAAAQEGLIVACDDARVLPEAQLDVPARAALRDYQEAAVDKLAKVTQGTVVIPCGGGKTRVGMGAIARLRTPTLILVHTLDLAEQWLGELRDKLGVEAGPHRRRRGAPAPVTVAVIQALVRWEPTKLDAFLGRFGLLILDEAHHVAASTFHSVVDRCPARYRLGLTATPEREDGLTALLDLFLGAPLVVVTHEELVAAGVLTVPEIRSVETDFTYPYTGAEDYAPMLAAVASDGARNRLIVDAVVARPGPATSASCSRGASTTASGSPRASPQGACRRRCSPAR
jgi:superfamily II DNA or RNA helicase